jgi:hypothetical protein
MESKSGYSDFCVYSIRRMQTLEKWHVEGRAASFEINQRWTAAFRHLGDARRRNLVMPILFAPSEITKFVVGKANLSSLEVDKLRTKVHFDNFKLLRNPFKKTSLVKHDGKPLNRNFIRPYAICKTPARIAEWAVYSHDYTRLGEQALFTEGGTIRILANKYERDPRAREEYIRIHWLRCAACDMSFLERYGDIAAKVMHVHHVVPVQKGIRQTDPAKDLIPVCPNCHAVIHLEEPPLSVRQVRQMLARQAQTGGG